MASKLRRDRRVRALDLVRHRLAEVVQQRRTFGHLHVRADLCRHDAGEMDDLERVLEDVLPIARAEAKPAHDLHQLFVERTAIRLEDRLLARLDDRVVDLGLRRVVRVLDPGRMDAAVLNQLRERQLRDLAADPVERRQDDCLGRVVDDEVNARQMLERADVPTLAADDATFHVVGRKLDDRHGRLCGVARGHPLEGVGDEVPRPAFCLGARLLLELANAPRQFVPHEILAPLEQRQLRLVDSQARDPLELGELLLAGMLVLLLELFQVGLPVREALLPPNELGQLPVDLLFLREDALLDLDDPRPVICDLLVDLGAQLHGFLARGDLRLAPQRVGLALGVFDQLLALLLRGPEPRLSEHADGDCSPQTTGDKADQNPDDDLHGLSSWVGCPRSVTAAPHPAVRPARRFRIGGTSRHPRLAERSARSPLPSAFRCRG
jgi:hypothetical protein